MMDAVFFSSSSCTSIIRDGCCVGCGFFFSLATLYDGCQSLTQTAAVISHILEDKAVESIIQGKENLFLSLLGTCPCSSL
jgi:hypothetical protein